jgi:hypothetical protein
LPDTDRGPGRPEADECQPHYFDYINLVPDGDVVKRLERQITETATYLAAFSPAQAQKRESPGEGNAVVIEFPGYAAAANYEARSLADVMAEFTAVRGAFVALLRGLDKAAWERRAPSDWTLRRVRAVAYCMAGHELHHLESIRRQHGG